MRTYGKQRGFPRGAISLVCIRCGAKLPANVTGLGQPPRCPRCRGELVPASAIPTLEEGEIEAQSEA